MGIVQLINTIQPPKGKRRSLWVDPGKALLIAPGLIMRLFVDRDGDTRSMRARFYGESSERDIQASSFSFVDIGMTLIPRAIEVDDDGQRPQRIFCEFIQH